jgi:hypothetical protein
MTVTVHFKVSIWLTGKLAVKTAEDGLHLLSSTLVAVLANRVNFTFQNTECVDNVHVV